MAALSDLHGGDTEPEELAIDKNLNADGADEEQASLASGSRSGSEEDGELECDRQE